MENAPRMFQSKLIKHIISEAFQADTFDICLEFREKDTATKSYCYLLDFVKERNPQLISNLTLPTFDNVSTRVTLNHTYAVEYY